jgi:hypothetical protein
LAVPSTHELSSFFGFYHYKCKSERRETARLWWSAGRLVASLGSDCITHWEWQMSSIPGAHSFWRERDRIWM